MQTVSGPGEGLQPVPAPLTPSPEAVSICNAILRGAPITEGVERVVAHFAAQPDVEQVTIMVIQLRPRPTDGWEPLGDRAWLRVWRRPGSRVRENPPPADGEPRLLTLPGISKHARHQVVAIPDAEALPSETDRHEMRLCNGAAMVTRSMSQDASLHGSLAIAREQPGEWTPAQIADVELLSSALGSRIVAERARVAASAALQRADQAADSQQQFFASLGHELRTPISAILGSAEMLEMEARDHDSDLARTVVDDARVVLRAGEQLLAIVEDLLDTGRTLGEDSARRPVDAAEAVEDVLQWTRADASNAHVTVACEVPRGLRAIATPVAIRQVLTSLIGNAITHNRPGGTVTIDAGRVLDEYQRPRLRIRVVDDGPGLTPEQQREVFKPFVRFAAPGVPGVGLGLSLSRSLAERDGGLIGVESVPGQGATFWLDLPAADPA